MSVADSANMMRARAGPLVDASVVAEHLGVTRAYVYEHAHELGAINLPSKSRPRPDGTLPKSRPRLRFSLAEIDERLSTCSASRESDSLEPAPRTASRPRRRRRMGTSAELLPIRGRIPVDAAARRAS